MNISYFHTLILDRTIHYLITVFPAPGIPKQQKICPFSSVVLLSRHFLKASSCRSHVPASFDRGNLTSWCLLSGSNGVNISNNSRIQLSAEIEVSLTRNNYRRFEDTFEVLYDFKYTSYIYSIVSIPSI